jgi:hypothetical protein
MVGSRSRGEKATSDSRRALTCSGILHQLEYRSLREHVQVIREPRPTKLELASTSQAHPAAALPNSLQRFAPLNSLFPFLWAFVIFYLILLRSLRSFAGISLMLLSREFVR